VARFRGAKRGGWLYGVKTWLYRIDDGCIAGQSIACRNRSRRGAAGLTMAKTLVKPRTTVRSKTQRPPLYKVILLNDDYTPREFVVQVLKAVFRMNEDQAYRVMMTAHQRGACVIAVYTRDVAETKAKEATELGKSKGYPLFFTTEPEE
jgi:ATP-dependent Clp protease adaptor protein ClpS